MENWITGSFLPPNFVTFIGRQIFLYLFTYYHRHHHHHHQHCEGDHRWKGGLHSVWCMTPSHNIHQTAIGQAVVGITMLLHPSHNHKHRLKIALQRGFLGRAILIFTHRLDYFVDISRAETWYCQWPPIIENTIYILLLGNVMPIWTLDRFTSIFTSFTSFLPYFCIF